MARALAASAARDPRRSSAATSVPQEADNWNPEAVWKHLRYRTTERWLDGAGRGVPSVHALRRRRQHEVLGQRAVSAAARGLSGDRAPGRRVAGVADRLRHARAVLRARRAAVPRARAARRRSDRAAARAVSLRRRFRTRPAWRTIVDGLRRQGLHPSPLPLGLIRPGEPGGCMLCSTCNSFPCRIHAKSDAEVCGVEPALASANVTLWTNARALRLVADPAGQEGRGGRGRAQRRDRPRRGAARRRVVRRRQLGGAAAAIGQRHASRRPRELVGAGRPPLHGAPGDDDAGLPPAAEERHGVSEDRGDQRLLLRAARTATYPLGQIQSQGRTHGVMAQTRGARGSRCGRTTPGWRAASTGWRCPRICRATTTA